ncbi:polysaccharide deacetylase family protein [Draconibacterium sp.]|nr:polysaccharide deacetylase family protein [Draconibacterium sp.]
MRDQLIKACASIIPQALSNVLVGEFVPVFLLHRIIDCNAQPNLTEVKRLHTYLEYLRKNNYHPISISELIIRILSGDTLPERSVVFTVDDGFADQFEHLAPIFSQYDIPLTCFVITDMLDGILWPWDDQVKHIIRTTELKSLKVDFPDGSIFSYSLHQNDKVKVIDSMRNRLKSQDQTYIYKWLAGFYNVAEVEIPPEPPLKYRGASWEQAKRFVKQGHSIAAHSKTHRILSRLNDAEVRDEIMGSYQHLKFKLPEAVDIFAYPTGRRADFGGREEKIIRDSPLLGAVSVIPDAVRKGHQLEALPRFGLPNNMSDFLQCLSFIEVFKNKLRKIRS